MTITSRRHVSAFILAAGLVTAVVAFLPFGAGDREARSAAIPLLDDWGGEDSDKARAAMPEIFIGQVIERKGGVNIGEPGASPFYVPLYIVDVESTLKGSAKGRIKLGVTEMMFSNELSGGLIAVGQRCLFTAFGPEGDDIYAIDEGFGNFPIANDSERAELILKFEKLIARGERRERRVSYTATDLCDQPALHPKIDLQPSQGPAGTIVRVTATGLVRPEVAICWADFDTRFGEGMLDGVCTMIAQIVIPPDAHPGLYQMHVIGTREEQSRRLVQVIDEEELSATR